MEKFTPISPEEVSDRLGEIAVALSAGLWGRIKPWGGAGVVVSTEPAPPPTPNSFYPDPLHVQTPYARQVSWLFREIRDVANQLPEFGVWKKGFYTHLGIVCNATPPSATLEQTLFTILREVYVALGAISQDMPMDLYANALGVPMYLEMMKKDVDLDAVRAFFAERGVHVE
jgi:hypothetical protein